MTQISPQLDRCATPAAAGATYFHPIYCVPIGFELVGPPTPAIRIVNTVTHVSVLILVSQLEVDDWTTLWDVAQQRVPVEFFPSTSDSLLYFRWLDPAGAPMPPSMADRALSAEGATAAALDVAIQHQHSDIMDALRGIRA